MRTLALLAASLLAFGGLAGCVGGSDDPVNPNSAENGTTLPGGASQELLTVLAPLKSTLTAQADAWLAPGATFPVAASAPANAKGNVTYQWAIGPMPGTVDGPVSALDTGVIAAGASKALKYEAPGVYLMHCHPHPDMKHNVTVVEGFQSNATLEVFIVDGATPGEYRFIPENVVVAPGTEITYTNIGQQPHTATLEMSEPALKLLPLAAETGEVTLEGDGWMRIVSIVSDDEGRLGISQVPVYVQEIPANFAGSYDFEFDAGTRFVPVAPPVAVPVGSAKTAQVAFEYGGRAFINVTVEDPSGEGLNTVSVHLRKQTETQDSMTLGPGTLASDGIVNAGNYILEVVPEQGAQITAVVTIDVVYDLVPPPIAPAAPADGHGGHAH